ncbi:MAG: hypothetical protein K0U68_14520 [Gammaproteobacteria bacterium]|nr:hypothetical protein [Gammaproteobacteria bacterium]
MLLRAITLVTLIILAIIGMGPVPTTSLVCIYAVIFRPRWFKTLVDKIYQA